MYHFGSTAMRKARSRSGASVSPAPPGERTAPSGSSIPREHHRSAGKSAPPPAPFLPPPCSRKRQIRQPMRASRGNLRTCLRTTARGCPDPSTWHHWHLTRAEPSGIRADCPKTSAARHLSPIRPAQGPALGELVGSFRENRFPHRPEDPPAKPLPNAAFPCRTTHPVP